MEFSQNFGLTTFRGFMICSSDFLGSGHFFSIYRLPEFYDNYKLSFVMAVFCVYCN